jgi:hypothetical protein
LANLKRSSAAFLSFHPPATTALLPHHHDPRIRAEFFAMTQSQQVEHTDSISSQDPARDEQKKTKSKRPPSKRRSSA